jgi:hypothetical protein
LSDASLGLVLKWTPASVVYLTKITRIHEISRKERKINRKPHSYSALLVEDTIATSLHRITSLDSRGHYTPDSIHCFHTKFLKQTIEERARKDAIEKRQKKKD